MAVAECFAEWQEIQGLATKGDLLAVKSDLSDLRREMAEMKVELIKWVVGIGFAQAAMIISILKWHL